MSFNTNESLSKLLSLVKFSVVISSLTDEKFLPLTKYFGSSISLLGTLGMIKNIDIKID
mgnify:CR=1 FL=1